MDADGEGTPSRKFLSEREKRWSMNSTRVEQIVAELMKPISDLRRNFDTDLSALLEEYLTEAGLHALDAEEQLHEGRDPQHPQQPAEHQICNFAEVALLLQQSASIYGKKVDYLYQHVIDISENLHNSTQDTPAHNRGIDETQDGYNRGLDDSVPEGSTPRRKRACDVSRSWGAVLIEGSVVDRGATSVPPPVLPRPRLELLPRDLAPHDYPLTDLAGEQIGLLHDFLLTRPTREGLLVEVLELCGPRAPPLRAPSLPPPPVTSSPLPLPSPPQCYTPPPLPELPPPEVTEQQAVEKLVRKRNTQPKVVEETPVTLNFKLNKALRARLRRKSEFHLPRKWIKAVVSRKVRRIRAVRDTLNEDPLLYHDPISLDNLDHSVGFRGWSVESVLAASVVASQSSEAFEKSMAPVPDVSTVAEVTAAAETPQAEVSVSRVSGESDDDGFFEMSSLVEEAGGGGAELPVGAWCSAVLASTPGRGTFKQVLGAAASHPKHVSRLLLATLFLANAGNVEIIPDKEPLSANGFEIQILSRDPARYNAVAAEEEEEPNPAPQDSPWLPPAPKRRKATHDSDYSERSDTNSSHSEHRSTSMDQPGTSTSYNVQQDNVIDQVDSVSDRTRDSDSAEQL